MVSSMSLFSADDTAGSAASSSAVGAEPEVGVAPPGGQQRDHDDVGGGGRGDPAGRAAASRPGNRPDGRQHGAAGTPRRAQPRHPRTAHQSVHPAQLPDQLLHLLRHEPTVPGDVLRPLRPRAVRHQLTAGGGGGGGGH